jgi:hypothetical protein
MTAPYIQCMFIYPAGSPLANVYFTPTLPPVGKQPLDTLNAIRHDSITSSGIKQSVLERLDDVMTLTFSMVPESDLAAWKSFMTYALAGQIFAYRPNAADDTTWADYTLDSQGWTPKFIAPGYFSFELQCRMLVGSPQVSGS